MQKKYNPYEAALNSIADVIFISNLDGYFEDVYMHSKNDEVSSLKENLIGKHYSEIEMPISTEQIEKKILVLLETKQPQEFEYSIIDTDIKKWFSAKMSLRKNEDNEPTGFTTVAREITNAKNIELSLLKSKSFLQSIIESIGDIIILTSLDGYYENIYDFTNGKELAFPKDELIGKHISDFELPDIGHEFSIGTENLIQTGIPQEVEYSLKFNDKDVWFSAKINLRKNDENEPIGITIVIRNITNSKNLEKALVASESSITAILNSITDLIFLYDLNGICEKVYANLIERDLILPSSEIEGKHFKETMPDHLMVMHEEKLHTLLTTKKSQIYRYHLEVLGEINWFSAKISLRNNSEGNPIGITSIVRNITETKLSELKFKTIADFSKSWEYWYGNNKELIYISPACEEISGYTQDEFIENPSLHNIIIIPEHQSIYSNHLQATKEDQDVSEIDFQIVTKSGELRWIHHRCAEVIDDQGVSLGRRGSNSDITNRKNNEKHLEHLATHDALTGLPNRVLLMELFDQSISRTVRNKWVSAILFIDLDNFKSINDTYGHLVGDQFLSDIANKINQNTRNSDSLARISGDEFVLILENIESNENVEIVSKNILANLSMKNPLNPKNIIIGASIGACLFPEHGVTKNDLIRKADIAMYVSKTTGKNSLIFYTPELKK
jgi:diguanylate cyclase (GGDEF)-like protein/PAS domain S-box-containing protein